MAELVDSQNILSARLTFCLSKDVGQQAFAINLGASLAHLYCSSLYKKPNVLKRSGVHLLEVIKVWILEYFVMVLDVKPVIANRF